MIKKGGKEKYSNIKAGMQQLVINHFLLLNAHFIGLKW
jgi:hypothetical protein